MKKANFVSVQKKSNNIKYTPMKNPRQDIDEHQSNLIVRNKVNTVFAQYDHGLIGKDKLKQQISQVTGVQPTREFDELLRKNPDKVKYRQI